MLTSNDVSKRRPFSVNLPSETWSLRKARISSEKEIALKNQMSEGSFLKNVIPNKVRKYISKEMYIFSKISDRQQNSFNWCPK